MAFSIEHSGKSPPGLIPQKAFGAFGCEVDNSYQFLLVQSSLASASEVPSDFWITAAKVWAICVESAVSRSAPWLAPHFWLHRALVFVFNLLGNQRTLHSGHSHGDPILRHLPRKARERSISAQLLNATRWLLIDGQ